MGYHPRIETTNIGNFLTTRTRASELWLANNEALERDILGYAAKYAERYGVKLYALAIEGSHIQAPAMFERGNRANFMRDLNASIARAVDRRCPNYSGGRLWGRRYSCEFLPEAKDIERQFFYTVLQPVQDALVDKISDYPFYNCFHDAACGISRTFKLVDWSAYNEARRWSDGVRIKDFVRSYTLKYERLPGYENLSQKEYAMVMNQKLEEYRQEVLAKREIKTPLGRAALLKVVPGTPARNPKRSSPDDHRPRVLSECAKTRQAFLAWYFDIYFRFKDASARYRSGDLAVEFPPGTYRPPKFTIAVSVDLDHIFT